MQDLTLVQLVGELKTLQHQLGFITKRFEDVSHQISFKIEVAENKLIEDELINKPKDRV